MLVDILERRPHLGIIASGIGFVSSIVSFLQTISVVIGFVGALFGCIAGFYTWRIKRREWERDFRNQRVADDASDRQTRKDNEKIDRAERKSQYAEDRIKL